ncbi:NADAR family protein [Janthinobacterium fluminis]|uniref:NADAR family protein n=1 Tax=Janthinobacterium fluminis TaxID=2987524 RepID=A0ABT5JVD5_9BURK|nr:NADAR family protein [Janthinobacterium fluminis]MDC8756026.1 NADAR family protein [Janthinobacterium fluminis]
MKIKNTQELLAAIAAGATPDYLCFWGHTPAKASLVDKSCMSQWYPAAFSVDGVRYPTAEHYMMARKAALFGDTAVEARIIAAQLPSEVKKLGRLVANFDSAKWEGAREAIVFDGNLAKFGQNPSLKKFLLSSANSVIVEASPVDPIWGVGMAANDAAIAAPGSWKGLNLLGFALMQVRAALRA